MKGGVLWATKHSSAGCGMRSIISLVLVLAYVLGTRADRVFERLQALLQPFGIVHLYTDGAGVYKRHLAVAGHTVSKRQTQQIERKHLTLRTRLKRLARKTICFSKSVLMHDV